MRAPQYGQTAWQRKRRANNAALPAECPQTGRVAYYKYSKIPGGALPRAALYTFVKGRFKHQKHTKLTLPLWRTVPSPGVDSYDAWAGRYAPIRKGKGRNASKLLKKAYVAKHGSLGGPIVTNKQPRLSEVKATLTP
jgi:hypothetical protein